MKNLFGNINIKGTVVLGIITTILCVYLIQPIIDIAKNFSGNIFTSLVNYYFSQAATVSSNDFPRLGSFYIVTIFLCIVISIMLYSIKGYTKDIQYINKLNEQTKQANETKELSLIDKITDMEDQIIRVEEELKKISDKPVDSIKILKKKRIISVAGFSFYLIYLIYIVIFSNSPNITKNAFDIAIIKITPYVETAQVDMLKSDWVRMKTKSDYDTINDKIKLIIKENNLD